MHSSNLRKFILHIGGYEKSFYKGSTVQTQVDDYFVFFNKTSCSDVLQNLVELVLSLSL